jgi:hypothetical protein
MTADALRQRLHRARERTGKIVLRIEIDEVGLTEALIAAKMLDPRIDHDRAAVEAAVARMLELIIADRHA